MDLTKLREYVDQHAQRAAQQIRALNQQMNTPGQVELGQNAIQFQAQLMAEQDKLKVFAEVVGMIDEHMGHDTPQAKGRIEDRAARAEALKVDEVAEDANTGAGINIEALVALKKLLQGIPD